MRIEEKGDSLVITDFNEIEAYKIACKIEKDGLEFYKNLLEAVSEAGTKNAFQLLIGEEKKHLAFFERAIFEARKRAEDVSEDNDLLEAMDYGIFSAYKDIEELKRLIKSRKKALSLGIIIENNSIRFYEGLREKIGSSDTREELACVIKEEQAHKQLLENILLTGK